jgi:hypothetical protein
MSLPALASCGACREASRCMALGIIKTRENRTCDFFPRQFKPKVSAWPTFHDAGFETLWYAGTPAPYQDRQFGPRWHAGIWTGPDSDLVCVVPSGTAELAEEALSPAGWSPEEAAWRALELRYRLVEARGRCQRASYCTGVAGHPGDCAAHLGARDLSWVAKETL